MPSVVLSRSILMTISPTPTLFLIGWLCCNGSSVGRQVINCSCSLQPGKTAVCFGPVSASTLPVAENCAASLPVAASASDGFVTYWAPEQSLISHQAWKPILGSSESAWKTGFSSRISPACECESFHNYLCNLFIIYFKGLNVQRIGGLNFRKCRKDFGYPKFAPLLLVRASGCRGIGNNDWIFCLINFEGFWWQCGQTEQKHSYY